jgi:hypothetical protein
MSALTSTHESPRRSLGIDATRESLLPLNDVPKHLHKALKKRLHVSAPYRWAGPGLRGVRLETICVGGRLVTSTEALARFFAAVAKARRED